MKNAFRTVLCAAALSVVSVGAFASELTTTFADNNEQNGNMFDVVTLGDALTVTGLYLNLYAGTTTIEVYEKSGTWVGSDTDASAWVLVSSTSVTSAGNGSGTYVDVTDFALAASSVTGLYITATNNNLGYTNGTAVGNVAAQNADLEILEGAGKAYAFSSTYTPRIWNGTLEYTLSAVPEPSTYAMLLAGLGVLGFAARRKSQA